MEGKAHSSSFLRLLSDESCSSTVTEDSCEYYQPEIHDQLPSSLPHRRWQQRGPSEGAATHGDEPVAPCRDWDPHQPLKGLPLCMQGKRNTREQRQQQRLSIGYWESWRRSQRIARRRLREQVGRALSGLLPWRHTLHYIEGKFGMGVKAYFVFLRYLLCLNLLHFLIIGGTVLMPALVYGRKDSASDHLTLNSSDSFLDFFLGSGFLGRSPVFYGFYTQGSLDMVCLNTPLLFLLGIASILILSLVMVVRRTVVGYKHTWLTGNRYSLNTSYKVFCGWDFCTQDPQAVALQHSIITNDIKMDLEEERFQLKESQRTLGERARLYFLRVVLNVMVLVLLSGSFYSIHKATVLSQDMRDKNNNRAVNLLLEYLPPIAITLANFLLPYAFLKISAFEDYSLTTQLNVTLVRSIFLKLGSLGLYLLFLYKTRRPEAIQCWENEFGKEMYRLSVFDFLASFCDAVVAYPRKWLVERYPASALMRKIGRQRFIIPFNVLDLVNSQTVTWAGVFYCPLLPAISILKLLTVFYIKKFTLRYCVPADRMFRTSSSSVLFHFMLLLGLIMSVVTLGLNVIDFAPGSCGPFEGRQSVFNVMSACVQALPGPARVAVRYLSSEAFALPMLMAEIVILTSYVSRRRANQKAIERLKDMLVMCSSDKRFLVKQHSTLLRRRRPPRNTVSAGTAKATSQDPSGPPRVLRRSVSEPCDL